ncbi:MAG: DNA primase [Candidatus Aenigmarchaeota archaeon]|nr:DNA primase [Candidatus Aenigmarchaeota archaeon]
MSKLPQATSKYTIFAKFTSDGIVEKPDVIGAIFGQTEGLLGPDMDLRELQRTGRIGRIEVELKSNNGKTSGMILIPSSLDTSETALIAATLETIERVGPCNAEIKVEKVEDIRAVKRKYVVERAKEILKTIFQEGLPETQEIAEEIKEAVRSSEISKYKGLPAGPNITNYDSIIVCEGRADVVKLLKNGIKNVIAIEGTSVPQAIVDLTKEKTTTVFLDGDRGGDLILKEIIQKGADIDFVARAPRGKEVEDLTKKEIYKALRDKIPADQIKDEINGLNHVKNEKKEFKQTKPVNTQKISGSDLDQEKKKKFKETLFNLTGTRAAYLFDKDMNILGKIPVKEIFSAIREVKDIHTLIFDGTVDQRIVNFAASHNIKYLIGMKKSEKIHIPQTLRVLAQADLN